MTITDNIKIIEITDTDRRIYETICYDVYDYIENVLIELKRRGQNKIILENTNQNPERMTEEEKENLIINIDFKTLKEISKIII